MFGLFLIFFYVCFHYFTRGPHLFVKIPRSSRVLFFILKKNATTISWRGRFRCSICCDGLFYVSVNWIKNSFCSVWSQLLGEGDFLFLFSIRFTNRKNKDVLPNKVLEGNGLVYLPIQWFSYQS